MDVVLKVSNYWLSVDFKFGLIGGCSKRHSYKGRQMNLLSIEKKTPEGRMCQHERWDLCPSPFFGFIVCLLLICSLKPLPQMVVDNHPIHIPCPTTGIADVRSCGWLRLSDLDVVGPS